MKKVRTVGTILLFSLSVSLTVGAKWTAAQGPAGAGSSTATQDSSHLLNPINWVKKDSSSSKGSADSRADAEKKLTPILQSQGVVVADGSVTTACAPFTKLDSCLAVLHASHNLNVDFGCLRAAVTGVHGSGDMSGCKAADGDKAQSLHTAIHHIKPDANAKQATKDAEQQAKDDLKGIGS